LAARSAELGGSETLILPSSLGCGWIEATSYVSAFAAAGKVWWRSQELLVDAD
jgi:hypothetical protein